LLLEALCGSEELCEEELAHGLAVAVRRIELRGRDRSCERCSDQSRGAGGGGECGALVAAGQPVVVGDGDQLAGGDADGAVGVGDEGVQVVVDGLRV
jgi:hypothetical protein